jgi:hypothetical protein
LAIRRANEAPSPGPTPAITATSELKEFIHRKATANHPNPNFRRGNQDSPHQEI